jgi:acetoin utilization protein AcuB
LDDDRLLTRDIMSAPVETIARGAGALAAADRMAERKVLHLVVVDTKGRIAGIVSDRDLRSAQPSVLPVPDPEMRKKALGMIKVDDVMTAHPTTVHDDLPVEDALAEMMRKRLGCLPVIDRGGALVGIVTGGDVAKLALKLLRERRPEPRSAR